MSSVCDADLRQGCTMLTLLPYICQNNLRNIVHQIFLRFVGEYFRVFLDERFYAQLGYQLRIFFKAFFFYFTLGYFFIKIDCLIQVYTFKGEKSFLHFWFFLQ